MKKALPIGAAVLVIAGIAYALSKRKKRRKKV